MAGSKPGEHRGGRKKGTPNKDKQELIDMIQAEYPDYHPLLALAEIANTDIVKFSGVDDDGNPITIIDHNLKFQASKEVCKYIVPQLKAVELTGKGGEPIKVQCYRLPDGTEIDF